MECPRCHRHTLLRGKSEDKPPVEVFTCTMCTRTWLPDSEKGIVPYETPAVKDKEVIGAVEKELPSKKRLSDETKAAIFERLVAGTKPVQIADEVGCSMQAVYTYKRWNKYKIEDEQRERRRIADIEVKAQTSIVEAILEHERKRMNLVSVR